MSAISKQILLTLCLGVSLLLPLPGQSQISTNTLEISVAPPDGSLVVSDSTVPVFVTVLNPGVFTNIFITSDIDGQMGPVFLDDGAPPDETAEDSIFSSNITVPFVSEPSSLTLTVLARAIDPNGIDEELEEGEEGDPVEVEVFATNVVEYPIAPRPPNEFFTNALKFPSQGGLILTSNTFARLEPDEPLHADVATVEASVWFVWSSPVATNVLIDTAGSAFDPVLAVYTGETIADLSPVAASINDVENGLQANVNVDAGAGVTYRIAVAGHDANGQGAIRLRVVPGGMPDTEGPQVTINDPFDGSLFTNDTITVSGLAREVRPDDTGIRQVFVQVNEEPPVMAEGTEDWAASITLPPGTNQVRAFGVDIAGNEGPADVIEVRFKNPLNDVFEEGIELIDVQGMILAINGRAIREEGEPLHAGNEGGHSIWYRWRAPSNGHLSLTTEGSRFDTLLAVYRGDTLTNLTRVAENDDASPGERHSALTAQVDVGELYHIAIDGFGAESGEIEFTFSFNSTDTFYRLEVGDDPGGTVTPGSGLYVVDSTLEILAVPEGDFQFVGWTGDVTSDANPLEVTLSGDMTVLPQFFLDAYTDSFESGGLSSLPWTSGGDSPWSVISGDASHGQFMARSGLIGDGGSSTLVLRTNTPAGTGSFDLRVSSEANWDRLEFFLNGVKQGEWSGEVPWTSHRFRLESGFQVLSWRYSKDANFSEGLDAAFVDKVYLPLPPPGEVEAGVLSVQWETPNLAVVRLEGSPNRVYRLEASSDLEQWSTVMTSEPGTGVVVFEEAIEPGAPSRFFRGYSP